MSIEDFVQSVAMKDYSTAENHFKELMQDRIQGALDQQKMSLKKKKILKILLRINKSY